MPETVPVQIADDAAAKVETLGMRRELEQMIEYAIQTAPGLRFIRVRLEVEDPHPALGPLVVIEVYRHPPPGKEPDKVDWGWWEWNQYQPFLASAAAKLPIAPGCPSQNQADGAFRPSALNVNTQANNAQAK